MSSPIALTPLLQTPLKGDVAAAANPGSTDFKDVLNESMSQANPKNDPKKVAEAARQFEALMIGQILKNARATGDDGWLGSGEDSSSGTATDMAQEFFGQALANAGGLGIAKVVTANLTRR